MSATRRGHFFSGRCVVGVLSLFAIFGFTGAALATSYTYEIYSTPFNQSALDSIYSYNTTNQLGDTVLANGNGFSLCLGGNCSQVNPPSLPNPASNQVTFLGINNRDQVAVTYGNPFGPCYSYSWEKGVYTQLSGMYDAHITGINNRGEIVGSYNNNLATGYAYVWQSGQSTALNPSGASWEYTRPYGINEEGKVWGWGNILGLGRMLDGMWSNEYWFTATPVRTPEPYNLLLIASGLIALLGLRKSVRR
jgi:hypothetical protein